jgi:carbon storage regulator CsrA
MLVLSRRAADQILIPSLGITLEVLSIKGNVVKLGIDAPQSVRVLRGELAQKHAESSAEPTGQENQANATSLSSGNEAPLRSYLTKGSKRGGEAKRIVNGLSAKSVNQCTSDVAKESIKEHRATYEVCV